MVRSRISVSPTSIDPKVTSYRRGTRALIVVLPAPDGPTKAVMVPDLAVKVKPFKTTPLSTVSGFATDSSEESEISSAFG